MQPSQRRAAPFLVLLVMFLVGCDHATKFAATRSLSLGAGGRDVTVLSGVLDLRYACNDDTAFSLLHDVSVPGKAWLLVGIASLATLGVLAAWFRRRRSAPLTEHLAWAAIASGAIANVVDRAARGCVVDFVRLPHWPIFNVADVLVVLGVVGLVLLTSKRARDRSRGSVR